MSRFFHDRARSVRTEMNGHLEIISLSRPERKNALNKELIDLLNEAIEFTRKSSSRVILFKSDVENCFCAGADLKERAKMTPLETESFVDYLRETIDRISKLEVPIVAAIDGIALGGGLELALACDLRYAGKEARLGLPETKLAIFPAAGGSQRLTRIVGEAKAKELIFTGRILNGTEAFQYGIVNGVSLSGFDSAVEIAEQILGNGPIGLKMAKKSINSGHHLPLSQF